MGELYGAGNGGCDSCYAKGDVEEMKDSIVLEEGCFEAGEEVSSVM